MIEKWFSGVHSDCGGGYELNNAPAAASNIPLRWLVSEAVDCGLLIDPEALCEAPAWGGIDHDEIRALIPARYRNEDSKTSSPVNSEFDADVDWRAIVAKAAELDSVVPASPSTPLPPDLLAPLHESLKGLWKIVEWLLLAEYQFVPGSSRRKITWT